VVRYIELGGHFPHRHAVRFMLLREGAQLVGRHQAASYLAVNGRLVPSDDGIPTSRHVLRGATATPLIMDELVGKHGSTVDAR